MVQALGGSMLTPVAMSIVVHTFPEPKERARAIGIWGAVAGVSMALGPLAGGALTQGAGWHSIFWINIPIGLAAIFLAMRYVPESRAPRPRRPDPVEIGRAPCRERVGQYVEISVVAGALQKKKKIIHKTTYAI